MLADLFVYLALAAGALACGGVAVLAYRLDRVEKELTDILG